MTSVEVEILLDSCLLRPNRNPEFRIFAQRDRLAIGLVVAAGLRRDEAASLNFDDIPKQDKRTVLNIKGKVVRDRAAPISDRLAEALVDWRFLV